MKRVEVYEKIRKAPDSAARVTAGSSSWTGWADISNLFDLLFGRKCADPRQRHPFNSSKAWRRRWPGGRCHRSWRHRLASRFEDGTDLADACGAGVVQPGGHPVVPPRPVTWRWELRGGDLGVPLFGGENFI